MQNRACIRAHTHTHKDTGTIVTQKPHGHTVTHIHVSDVTKWVVPEHVLDHITAMLVQCLLQTNLVAAY